MFSIQNVQCSTSDMVIRNRCQILKAKSSCNIRIPYSIAFKRRIQMENNNRNTVLDIHPENVIKMQTFSIFDFWRSVLIQSIVWNEWCTLYCTMHDVRSTMPDEIRASHPKNYCHVLFRLHFSISNISLYKNSTYLVVWRPRYPLSEIYSQFLRFR